MSDKTEYVCGYCGGDAQSHDDGWRHATVAERIKNISPGDMVSARHNTVGRILPEDLMTREEYEKSA